MFLKLRAHFTKGLLTFRYIKLGLSFRAKRKFGVTAGTDIKKTGDMFVHCINVSKLGKGASSTNITIPGPGNQNVVNSLGYPFLKCVGGYYGNTKKRQGRKRHT